jgi:hypothetical protein
VVIDLILFSKRKTASQLQIPLANPLPPPSSLKNITDIIPIFNWNKNSKIDPALNNFIAYTFYLIKFFLKSIAYKNKSSLL